MQSLELADLVRLALGVAGTWFGAELLVRGSARLALALGLSPLLVGLTVVALGTSSPEAVVSFVAAVRGSGGIAVGNVVGSNIANIGLILGIVSLIHPMQIRWKDVARDSWIMVAATVVAGLSIFLGTSNRPVGLLLMGLLGASIILAVRQSAAGRASRDAPVARDARSIVVATALSVAGLAILVVSARLMVVAAEAIALKFGVEEAVIGATVVAVGTSIPELAASLVAVVRRHYDIGIGNLIGSNLMNLSFVFGSICLFRPGLSVSPEVAQILVPVMGLFTLVFVPMLATGGQVRRWEGGILLAGYLTFAWFVYF